MWSSMRMRKGLRWGRRRDKSVVSSGTNKASTCILLYEIVHPQHHYMRLDMRILPDDSFIPRNYPAKVLHWCYDVQALHAPCLPLSCYLQFLVVSW